MKPVIETHDLCKSYNGRTVVDHLNLTVPQSASTAQARTVRANPPA